MKSEYDETPKQEQPALQGVHPSEALQAAFSRKLVEDTDNWILGKAYCGTDGTCESCQ